MGIAVSPTSSLSESSCRARWASYGFSHFSKTERIEHDRIFRRNLHQGEDTQRLSEISVPLGINVPSNNILRTFLPIRARHSDSPRSVFSAHQYEVTSSCFIQFLSNPSGSRRSCAILPWSTIARERVGWMED